MWGSMGMCGYVSYDIYYVQKNVEIDALTRHLFDDLCAVTSFWWENALKCEDVLEENAYK